MGEGRHLPPGRGRHPGYHQLKGGNKAREPWKKHGDRGGPRKELPATPVWSPRAGKEPKVLKRSWAQWASLSQKQEVGPPPLPSPPQKTLSGGPASLQATG